MEPGESSLVWKRMWNFIWTEPSFDFDNFDCIFKFGAFQRLKTLVRIYWKIKCQRWFSEKSIEHPVQFEKVCETLYQDCLLCSLAWDLGSTWPTFCSLRSFLRWCSVILKIQQGLKRSDDACRLMNEWIRMAAWCLLVEIYTDRLFFLHYCFFVDYILRVYSSLRNDQLGASKLLIFKKNWPRLPNGNDCFYFQCKACQNKKNMEL